MVIAKNQKSITIKYSLLCGIIAGPIFLLLVIVEGHIRDDYNALRYPLSSLSFGEHAWMQIANFILTGMLLVFFSRGWQGLNNTKKKKSKISILICLAGVGLIGAGVFVTYPLFGYPENKPLLILQYTWHGNLHDAFSMLVFICLPWACFVFAGLCKEKDQKSCQLYSLFTGITMIVTFIIASMGFRQVEILKNVGGLFQRICIAAGLLWITSLAAQSISKKDTLLT
ncbi:MAG: DUF998 domain-containing protein [Segetibacter sp.]